MRRRRREYAHTRTFRGGKARQRRRLIELAVALVVLGVIAAAVWLSQ